MSPYLRMAGLLAALVLPATGMARGAEPYDATAMVVDAGGGKSQVAISYAHVVDHGQLSAGIRVLGRATGASISGVSVREEALARGETGRGTSVEFDAAGLLRSGAPFPVEAFARALPGWQRLQLAFLPGEAFTFAGPQEGEVEGRSYRLVSRAGAYGYDLTTEAAPKEAPRAETATGGPARREARGPGGGIRNIVLGVSALALALAVWILSQSLRKSMGRSRG